MTVHGRNVRSCEVGDNSLCSYVLIILNIYMYCTLAVTKPQALDPLPTDWATHMIMPYYAVEELNSLGFTFFNTSFVLDYYGVYIHYPCTYSCESLVSLPANASYSSNSTVTDYMLTSQLGLVCDFPCVLDHDTSFLLCSGIDINCNIIFPLPLSTTETAEYYTLDGIYTFNEVRLNASVTTPILKTFVNDFNYYSYYPLEEYFYEIGGSLFQVLFCATEYCTKDEHLVHPSGYTEIYPTETPQGCEIGLPGSFVCTKRAVMGDGLSIDLDPSGNYVLTGFSVLVVLNQTYYGTYTVQNTKSSAGEVETLLVVAYISIAFSAFILLLIIVYFIYYLCRSRGMMFM